MALKKHNLKKNVNYTKKHKVNAKDILAKDLSELASMKKEELRQALVVVNQQANKELLRISRMSDENKTKLIDKNPMLQNRIILGTKGQFSRFSTWHNMTKGEMIKELTNRKLFFDNTPTPQQQKAKEEYRNKIIKEYLHEYGQIEYDELEGAKPTLKKIGKILQRLEDNHYIAAKAGTSGYSLGSVNVMRIAFNIAFDNPYKGVDNLFNLIETKLKEEEVNLKKAYKRSADLMNNNYGA